MPSSPRGMPRSAPTAPLVSRFAACEAAACWATWLTSSEVGGALPLSLSLDTCQGFAGGAPDILSLLSSENKAEQTTCVCEGMRKAKEKRTSERGEERRARRASEAELDARASRGPSPPPPRRKARRGGRRSRGRGGGERRGVSVGGGGGAKARGRRRAGELRARPPRTWPRASVGGRTYLAFDSTALSPSLSLSRQPTNRSSHRLLAEVCESRNRVLYSDAVLRARKICWLARQNILSVVCRQGRGRFTNLRGTRKTKETEMD